MAILGLGRNAQNEPGAPVVPESKQELQNKQIKQATLWGAGQRDRHRGQLKELPMANTGIIEQQMKQY